MAKNKPQKSKGKGSLKARIASLAKRPTRADRAEKELQDKERHYNALGRYIHEKKTKLVDLRQRWDRGERTTELFQEISALTLPES